MIEREAIDFVRREVKARVPRLSDAQCVDWMAAVRDLDPATARRILVELSTDPNERYLTVKAFVRRVRRYKARCSVGCCPLCAEVNSDIKRVSEPSRENNGTDAPDGHGRADGKAETNAQHIAMSSAPPITRPAGQATSAALVERLAHPQPLPEGPVYADDDFFNDKSDLPRQREPGEEG